MRRALYATAQCAVRALWTKDFAYSVQNPRPQAALHLQNVALFLCDHCGEYLDDFLYISGKENRRAIKSNVAQKIQADATSRRYAQDTWLSTDSNKFQFHIIRKAAVKAVFSYPMSK